MNIGELSALTGLTRSRIRFYESRGLIKAVSRSDNGYRRFGPEAVLILTLITSAQKAGFSLDEIARVLPSDLDIWQHEELVAMLRRKVADISAMITQLETSRGNLEQLIARIEGKPADMACAENARRIVADIGVSATAP